MDKKFVIKDYNGKKMKITITNYENVFAILYELISSDQVLTVKYNDGSEKIFDSCEFGRSMAFHEITEILKPNELTQEKLDELYI